MRAPCPRFATLEGMAWYGWLILGVALFVALTVLLFRLIRSTKRGRRFLALPSRGKLRFGHLLLIDPAVPLPAKLVLVVLVGYLALPLDLIPDFIPVLGQADDIAMIVLAVAILMFAVPR